ncbi:MAG TPA: polysulfide reductase NrfD [Polyangiaceae bacterium]|nr:polysulfide reductase NrfD [Polyangiaceae bacterium]
MDTRFERIEGGGRGLVLLTAGLGALALAGVWSTFRMYVEGVYLSGMTNRVPWGLQIVLGIFYIGLSAGSLVISSLYGLFGRSEYRPFARVAAFAAVLLMVGALLSIVSDQGRIDRVFVQPFLHLNPLSMLSINPFLYASYVLIGVAYLGAMLLESERWTRALALLAVLWAILVHSGTGAIFGFVPRELYRSPLLPPSFVAAALSSGTALMILVFLALFRLTRRRLDDELILWVGRLLGVFVLVAAYFVLVENVHRLYLRESREAARFFLFGGPHAALFWGGMVLLGTLVPAVLLFGRRTRGSVPWVAVASALVVLGVLCERYLIVIPGLAYPPELLPGWRIARSGFEEGIASYHVSGYELLQAAGVLGVVALLFTWGLKLLRLLPAEARALPRGGGSANEG